MERAASSVGALLRVWISIDVCTVSGTCACSSIAKCRRDEQDEREHPHGGCSIRYTHTQVYANFHVNHCQSSFVDHELSRPVEKKAFFGVLGGRKRRRKKERKKEKKKKKGERKERRGKGRRERRRRKNEKRGREEGRKKKERRKGRRKTRERKKRERRRKLKTYHNPFWVVFSTWRYGFKTFSFRRKRTAAPHLMTAR